VTKAAEEAAQAEKKRDWLEQQRKRVTAEEEAAPAENESGTIQQQKKPYYECDC